MLISKKLNIKRPLCLVCLVIVLLLYGLTKLRGMPQPEEHPYEGTVELTGTVYKKETAEQFGVTSLIIYLKAVRAGPDEMQGVICYLSAGEPEPEQGSRVMVRGKCKSIEQATNPGQFDAFLYYQILDISYRLYQTKILAKTNEYNDFQEGVYQFRQRLADILDENLEPKESAAMKAMLLGEKNSMDQEMKALYQRHGIAHILSISGLHISMLGLGLFKLLKKMKLSNSVACTISVLFIVAYGVMIGFSASAVRAIIMFLLHMLAKLLHRTYDMLTAVAVAAVLLLIEQPLYLYHSGFVFSFGCVLGIALIMPALTDVGKRKQNQKQNQKQNHKNQQKYKHNISFGALGQALLSGVTIAVITLPIYLWFFFQFPVYSIVLNFLVIPLMTLLMIAGILILPVGLLAPATAAPIAAFIKGVFILYETACLYFEEFPVYLFTPGRPAIWQVVCYLLILGTIVATQKRTILPVRWLLVMLAVTVLIIRPKADLQITFLDVGQGDCIFVRNGAEGNYLIDGGSSSSSGVGNYRIIPFLKYMGASSLEAVFVTHADMDHCNGILELMEEGKEHGIEINNLVLPEVAQDSRDQTYEELMKVADANGIEVLFISRGDRIENDKLTISCLHPISGYQTENANEYSTVLLLQYDKCSTLLTGDVEGAGEQQMLQYLKEEQPQTVESNVQQNTLNIQPLTVLKVAHHGSSNSTDLELLEMLRPSISIISCGKDNSYGHPHVELIERLESVDTLISRTDQSGAVTLISDGTKVTICKFIVE